MLCGWWFYKDAGMAIDEKHHEFMFLSQLTNKYNKSQVLTSWKVNDQVLRQNYEEDTVQKHIKLTSFIMMQLPAGASAAAALAAVPGRPRRLQPRRLWARGTSLSTCAVAREGPRHHRRRPSPGSPCCSACSRWPGLRGTRAPIF